MDQIRLERFQYEAIIAAFKQTFLPSDYLWIFGSRVDLQARGGDIDLYVETNCANMEEAYDRKSKFIDLVWDKIGEQKIDVVLNVVQSNHAELPIFAIARNQGIKLI
jgi:hypothetical protein